MINISIQNIFNLAIKNIEIPVLGLTIPWITLTPISIIWFSTLIYVSRISISSIKSTFAHVETSCVFFTITFASTCSTFSNSPLTSVLGLNYPGKPQNTPYKPDHNRFRISQSVKVIIYFQIVSFELGLYSITYTDWTKSERPRLDTHQLHSTYYFKSNFVWIIKQVKFCQSNEFFVN